MARERMGERENADEEADVARDEEADVARDEEADVARDQEPIVIHRDPEGYAAAEASHASRPRHMPAGAARIGYARPAAEPFDADASRVDASAPDRAVGLDVLRGVYLLAMTFAFTIPDGVFARWMYHIQYPPPIGAFAPQIAGLGWRDLLFGGFLFTMAAALPITMGRRLEKGTSYPEVLWIAVKRAFLLFVFALIIGHVNPYWTGDYTRRGNALAIAGFLICFMLFTRRQRNWNEKAFRWIRRFAWLAALVLLFAGPRLYGASFSLARNDGIITAIAFAVVAGTAIWIATRRSILPRLLVMGVVLALMLGSSEPGWVQDLWGVTPAVWLYQSWYLELLLIVVPGTIAGDLVSRWMHASATATPFIEWSGFRLGLLLVASLAFLPIVLVGTYTRDIEIATFLTIGLAIAGSLLCTGAHTEREGALAALFWWAAAWLVIGMLAEPFGGGVRKDPQTLSYLLLSSGLSSALLVAAVIAADALDAGKRLLRPIAVIGQNPMLAYVLYMLFIMHLLYLVGVGDILTGGARQAVVRGFLFTALAGVLVWAASRARLYWRA